MMTRTQISMDLEMLQKARRRAGDLQVSLAEYIRRLIARDLQEAPSSRDVSLLFDLGGSGGSDVGRDKDAMVADAFGADRPRR